MAHSSNPVTSAQAVAVFPVPVGGIIAYAGSDVPNGWLLCNGQAITSTNYPNLHALIGDNVPDLRSRFIVGAGTGAGLTAYNIKDTGGEEKHPLTIDELPSHSHTLGMAGGFRVRWQGDDKNVMTPESLLTNTSSVGSNLPHENRPPYYALSYIIKY